MFHNDAELDHDDRQTSCYCREWDRFRYYYNSRRHVSARRKVVFLWYPERVDAHCTEEAIILLGNKEGYRTRSHGLCSAGSLVGLH